MIWRYPALILLLSLLPAMAMAQGRKDYKAAMAQFMALYNSNDAAGISGLFSAKSGDRGRYTSGKLYSLKTELRDLRSFTYLRQREDGLIIFSVRYAKYKGKYPELHQGTTGYIGLRLDKDNKILRLRMPTYAYPGDEQRYLFK